LIVGQELETPLVVRVEDQEDIVAMRSINKELIQMVKDLLAKSRDPEKYSKDEDIQAYVQIVQSLNEQGQKMMQRIHDEIRVKQVEFNELLMR